MTTDRHDALSKAVLEMADRLEKLRANNSRLRDLLEAAVFFCEERGFYPPWQSEAKALLKGEPK